MSGKWIVYGAGGYLGEKYSALLEKEGIEFIASNNRADDPEAVAKELDDIKPTNVVSLVGRMHGPGFKNIDYLEQPGKLVDNCRDNLYAPLTLALACEKRGIHLTYMGSGCIFRYDGSGTAITEADKPNFFGSAYGVMKGFTDNIMKQFDSTVLNCRIRIPIAAEHSQRNFITKILTYPKIHSVTNSLSVLDDILPLMVDMGKRKVTGTFNMTNPGTMCHNDILKLYKEIVDPTHAWTNFTEEELKKTLKGERSNCETAPNKLLELYPDLPSAHDAVRAVMHQMKPIGTWKK